LSRHEVKLKLEQEISKIVPFLEMLIDPANKGKGCLTQACKPLIKGLPEWLVSLIVAVLALNFHISD
jgi:hypothetical protein